MMLNQTTEKQIRENAIYFWSHQYGGNEKYLSQWYVAPFSHKGILYSTAEHWMMAEKARLFNDQVTLEKILHSETPGEAKSLGRTVNGFVDEIWCQYRFQVVCKGNFLKFGQNELLREYLESTKDSLIVEASPHDAVWGIGMDKEHALRTEIPNWPGINLLGICLMNVRETFKLI